MAQITVSITGVSRDATFQWDGPLQALVRNGNNFSTAFDSAAGIHRYSIDVLGSPDDAWTGTVTDGTTTHNHGGNMDDRGMDTTGNTAFEVTA